MSGQDNARMRRKVFLTGMLSALLAGCVVLWGWQLMSRPRPAEQQLAASLAPLPSALTDEQLRVLQQTSLPAEEWMRKTRHSSWCGCPVCPRTGVFATENRLSASH